jgi:hypothetical protein
MTTEERLIKAINKGEKINITYRGGSQPGTLRLITPTGIDGGKVRAYCHTSNAVKLFAIDKILIVDGKEQPDLVSWQPGLSPPLRYTSIQALLEEHRNDFLQQGWYIETSTSHLSLHRTIKNGKPMKGSEVSLDFEEHTYDLVVNEEGETHEENFRQKERPWTVRAKNKDTRTYGSLDAASKLFLEWAGMLAPTAK